MDSIFLPKSFPKMRELKFRAVSRLMLWFIIEFIIYDDQKLEENQNCQTLPFSKYLGAHQ